MTTLSDHHGANPRPEPDDHARRKPNGGSAPSSPALQDMAAELAAIRTSVAASQAQSATAQRRADVLSVTNARLRRKLGSLSRQVEHARQFAFHDQLTGLANRALLVDRLQQAIGQARRQRKRVALVLLSLDGLRIVHDRFGRVSGDQLLIHVASVLKSCLRTSDTVCRYGGSEFVLMLPDLDDAEGVTTVVRKTQARLAAPFFVDGLPIPVAVSAGQAVYPDDGKDCVELLNHADMALCREKARTSANIL